MTSAARGFGIATTLLALALALALAAPAAGHDLAPQSTHVRVGIAALEQPRDAFVSVDFDRRPTLSERLARRYPPAEVYRSNRFSIRFERYRLERRHADRLGYARPGRY